MRNPWFRLYTEFAFDPKVQVLTEALQRRYVMALCLHCDGKLENRPDDEIALALRVTADEWKETKDIFIKRGLFSDVGIPMSWDKRQYISDKKDPTAADRQKRYRENKRNSRNDTVTSRLPEADTDNKKKNIKKKKISLPEWEGKNGELKPEMLEAFSLKHKQTPEQMVRLVEKFRSKCLASDYRYINFIRAFESWEWKFEKLDDWHNRNRMPSPAGG